MPRDAIDRLLPRTRLRDLDGIERDLRGGAGPQVVVFGGSDAARAAYLRGLASVTGDLRDWGARLACIVAEARQAVPGLEATWLLDPDVGAQDALSLLVVDQWGEVYHAADAVGGNAADALPAPQEIVDWVRFVAIQCPECEGPEGGWRDL